MRIAAGIGFGGEIQIDDFGSLYNIQKCIRTMLTLDKKQSANYFLLELLSEQTRLRESAMILKRKHGPKLDESWEAFEQESREDYGFYDDWMEYQSICMALRDLECRVSEIKSGDFSFT